MSRAVSVTLKSAVNAPETGEAFLVLVTIDHADLAAAIRVTSDGVDTVSNGNTFVAFPFEISLPDSRVEGAPRAKLTIDNVDRQIVQAVRDISTAADVTVDVVLASDPDTVEASFPDFKLRDVTFDALTVTGELTVEHFAGEPYPAAIFSPANFPGLF